MARRGVQLDSAHNSLYRSLGVSSRAGNGSPVETVDTRQQETIDNDHSVDLLVGLSLRRSETADARPSLLREVGVVAGNSGFGSGETIITEQIETIDGDRSIEALLIQSLIG